MADQRSVMKEYRLLDQKRISGTLTPQEEARLAQLRDLVGPEVGAGAARPGFDVNAAAARLRDSLLPAGLRNRPAPPPPEEVPPEPEPEAAPSTNGLEAVWNAAPFAPLTEASAFTEEALFDPGTLGIDSPADAAWDPSAQQYDPNAPAYDPNAQPYDANTQGWDPNAQPYDPNAQPYDASAQGWDPNAQPYDPNAQPYDASAQGWDPNAQWDPNATPQWDAATQQAWDPDLAAPWGGEPVAETPAAEGALTEQDQPLDAAWSAGVGAAAEPETEVAAGEWLEEAEPPVAGAPAAPAASGWDASAMPPEEPAAGEASWDAGLVAPEELAAEHPVEELLPFDASGGGAEGALEDVAIDDSMALPSAEPAALGSYGDLSGPEQPAQFEPLPSDEAKGLVAPLGAGQELTSDDDAFAQGFHTESNGSFGGASASGSPAAWDAQQQPPAAGEAWESTPTLDLGQVSDEVEEIPVVEGSLLEDDQGSRR